MCDMSVATQDGKSALIWAARESKTEVVVHLVKAGANVNLQDNVRQCIYYAHIQNHAQYLSQPFNDSVSYVLHEALGHRH